MEPRQDLMESIIEAITKVTKDLAKLIVEKDAEISKLKSEAADKESVDSEQSSRLQQALTDLQALVMQPTQPQLVGDELLA